MCRVEMYKGREGWWHRSFFFFCVLVHSSMYLYIHLGHVTLGVFLDNSVHRQNSKTNLSTRSRIVVDLRDAMAHNCYLFPKKA